MEQNRQQIEALVEDARHLRSVDAGNHLVAAWTGLTRWIGTLPASFRDAVRTNHSLHH